MRYILQSACLCNTGKIRKKNEDNFYFDGRCLEQENSGLRHPVVLEDVLKSGQCFAVFDGMGGENYGEVAAYTAAQRLQILERKLGDYFIPEKKYLQRLIQQMDEAVAQQKKELCTDHMGSTMVGCYFSGRYVYICNVGDSRAYRLRSGEFLQLSHDHVEKLPGWENKKAPLTQHLGMGGDEVQLEPYIAKGEINKGDIYLLCSDGLTDMLTNFEISDILLRYEDVAACVQALIDAALEHGGRDNITAIVCRLK